VEKVWYEPVGRFVLHVEGWEMRRGASPLQLFRGHLAAISSTGGPVEGFLLRRHLHFNYLYQTAHGLE
jgi:hypothetical protein